MIVLCWLIAAAAAAGRHHAVPSMPTHFCDYGSDVAGVTVPDGFCIRKFANVPTPRVLWFAPNGDLFVSSPGKNTVGGAPSGASAIFLFRQTDPTKPPQQFTFASGVSYFSVHGVAVVGNTFYYTVEDAVYSVPYVSGSTEISNSNTPTRVAILNSSSDTNLPRFAHTLAVGTDGSIYVSRGQFDSMICPPSDLRLGGVLRIGSGHNLQGDVVVSGLRDPLFIRCEPWNACYAAELTGDTWESLGGSEKIIELHDGDSYGYPCCIAPGITNPELNVKADCSMVASPIHTFPVHNTPFGFDWERGKWPEPYRGAFFIGLHGAFGSWLHTGLQWAQVDPVTHFPTGNTSDFATGFGREGAISRVGDVLFAPDGRLFFADDQGGAIYWIAPRSLSLPRP